MLLLNGDCLTHLTLIPDNSVDLIFCDLPYGQTSCEWDNKVDLDKLWIEFMRVKKNENTPIFMTTTTKFGVELITSAPKKCPFRYDLIWVKSAPCGFLSARKMPMRKHEMIYVFYEKLPYYDLSSHKHKFSKKATAGQNGATYGGGGANPDAEVIKNTYEPPLPVSAIYETDKKGDSLRKDHRDKRYDPPLPNSVIKQGMLEGNEVYKGKKVLYRSKAGQYDPPLPTSVLKDVVVIEKEELDCDILGKELPSLDQQAKELEDLQKVVRIESGAEMDQYKGCSGKSTGKRTIYQDGEGNKIDAKYDPPLPHSILEIKSKKGKHSTQKPVELMNWILKYYSKEGDVVLDPTMGSGSTGVSCKVMNREFVGIELDPEIYEVACQRLETEQ